MARFESGQFYVFDDGFEFAIICRTETKVKVQPKFGQPFHCDIHVRADGREEITPMGASHTPLIAR